MTSNLNSGNHPKLRGFSTTIKEYYDQGIEEDRLDISTGQLERYRTRDILSRFMPSPPQSVLDVGGATGDYTRWLAKKGYTVHLVDPVETQVEVAKKLGQNLAEKDRISYSVGDARDLRFPDESWDIILFFGPMYHLADRDDRLLALREANRILKPGGWFFAAAISRFASALDGLVQGFLDDPAFQKIVAQDLIDGQHQNPTDKIFYFTDAYFHRPDELEQEINEAGLHWESTLAVEGPAWMLQNFMDHWNDPERKARLLNICQTLEGETSLLGASSHLLAIAQKPIKSN